MSVNSSIDNFINAVAYNYSTTVLCIAITIGTIQYIMFVLWFFNKFKMLELNITAFMTLCLISIISFLNQLVYFISPYYLQYITCHIILMFIIVVGAILIHYIIVLKHIVNSKS